MSISYKSLLYGIRCFCVGFLVRLSVLGQGVSEVKSSVGLVPFLELNS